MIRGTTPTVTCTFPYDTSTLSKIRIYFIQGKETLLTKKETDCTLSGKTASITLTEEETFGFESNRRLEVKARYLKADGEVAGSLSTFTDVYDTGDDEILNVTEEDSEDVQQ